MSDQPSLLSWRVRMHPRDAAEEHRASTPLELLFDLSFVVAVSQVAAALAHDLADDHVADGLLGYLTVFFAIWWAWVNFTWFASAYDTDDVPYRLLTMLQMAGVLVLAAGVPQAFDGQDFSLIVVGYVLMRLAMGAQWLRAAAGDPGGRQTALYYVAGIIVLQVAWVLRIWVPEELALATFLGLAACEMALPYLAESRATTPWHPHHIAERYGLFTIIVLGECVLASTVAVESSVTEQGVGAELVVLAVAGLVLVFALWWLYFLQPAGEALEANRRLAFRFGYGHYGVFASVAALGAGIELAVEEQTHHVEAGPVLVAYAVAVPVAVYLLMVLLVFTPLTGTQVVAPTLLTTAAVVVLLLPLAAEALSVTAVVAMVAAVTACFVALSIGRQHALARHPGRAP